MTSLTPELRAALSLPDDTTIMTRGTHTPTAPSLGHGLTNNTEASNSLSARLEQLPDFDTVPLAPSPRSLRLRWWRHDPGVLIAEFEGAAPQCIGAHEALDEHAWLLDARRETVALRIEDAGAQLLLLCRPDRVEHLQLGPLAEMPSVPWRNWLSSHGADPWMLELLERDGEAPSAFARMHTAALVLCRWSPPAGTQQRTLTAALLQSPGAHPSQQARAWCRALSPALHTLVEREAHQRANSLLRAFEQLSTKAQDDADGAASTLLGLLEERDALAIVCAALEVSAPCPSLRSALRSVDDEAMLHLSVFGLAEHLSENPRVQAVSWQDPDAWWGTFATS